MKINFITSSVAIAIFGVVTAAAYFYSSRNREINEVMIFCKLQYNAHNYFDKLISFIEKAEKSVNVCMPGLHNPVIQGRLVELIKRKNIKVRILIDRLGYKESLEVFTRELVDAGAEIRCKINESYKIQHKFCLVDDKVLMTGTLDWGNDLSWDNWNYVYITSKKQLVPPVKYEFYHMWNVSTDLYEALELHPLLFHNPGATLGEDVTATPSEIIAALLDAQLEEDENQRLQSSSRGSPSVVFTPTT